MPSDLQTEVATATSSDLLHLASCSDYIMVVCEITEPRNFKAKRNMKIILPVLKFSPKEEIEGQSYKVTAQSYGAMSRESGDRSLVLSPCTSPTSHHLQPQHIHSKWFCLVDAKPPLLQP